MPPATEASNRDTGVWGVLVRFYGYGKVFPVLQAGFLYPYFELVVQAVAWYAVVFQTGVLYVGRQGQELFHVFDRHAEGIHQFEFVKFFPCEFYSVVLAYFL